MKKRFDVPKSKRLFMCNRHRSILWSVYCCVPLCVVLGATALKEWIGVEMDEEIGTHDGSLFGARYFTCADRHGVFAQTSQLQAA